MAPTSVLVDELSQPITVLVLDLRKESQSMSRKVLLVTLLSAFIVGLWQ